MAMILNCSIDLTKIDKSRIKEHKNGGKYYEITVHVNDDFDKFNNNVGITQKQSKEEKEAKERKVYIGNGKIAWASNPAPVKKKDETTTGETQANQSMSDDDLPF